MKENVVLEILNVRNLKLRLDKVVSLFKCYQCDYTSTKIKGFLSQLGALQVSDGLAFSRKIVNLDLNAICVRNFLRRKSLK